MSKPPTTDRNSVKQKKPDDNVSPDTLRAQALSKTVDMCACCNKRCTSTGKNSEAIQCDLCYSWVHATCEGISKSHFKSLNEILSVNNDNIIYLCKTNKCNVRFKQLLASKIGPCDQPEVSDLSSKVDNLATRSAKLEKDLAETIAFIKNVSTSADKSVDTDKGAIVSAASSRPLASTSNMNSSNDRRFNVVVYGIEECPTNTIRPARLQKDFDSVSSIFSGLGVTPDPGTIVDCYRLGKFKVQSPRPRPILVKFRSVIHVNQVLANKRSLSTPVFIKPDLSPEERTREAVLLKERWELLQKGYSRSIIRIRNNSIFVNNQLYGQVKNSVFQTCPTSLPQAPTDQPVAASQLMDQLTPLITLASPDPSSATSNQPK